MILDATTKSIEIDLAAAHTTTALPVTVDYVDMTTTTTVAGSSDTASNGTTAVTIVAAPAASTQRKVNYISVYNADTITHTVTIQLNNSSTLRSIIVASVRSGETLQYSDVNGWGLVTTTGIYALLAGSASQPFSVSTLTASTGLVGTTTNDSASAGIVGEYINSIVATGSAVSLTTGTQANVTSISLTAGDWDVSGVVNFNFGATTSVTRYLADISSTSATLGANYVGVVSAATVPGSVTSGLAIPCTRFSLASTTTVYLVAFGTFTVSTLSAFGKIQARRVR